MRATGRGSSFRSTGSGSSLIWVYAAVLLLGVLAGCTDQSGSKGPTGPAAGGLTVNLGGRSGFRADQFIITAFVRTLRGEPVAGTGVTFVVTAGAGVMNPVNTTTNQDGEATSVLTCRGAGATTVSVLVPGFGIGDSPSVVASCP